MKSINNADYTCDEDNSGNASATAVHDHTLNYRILSGTLANKKEQESEEGGASQGTHLPACHRLPTMNTTISWPSTAPSADIFNILQGFLHWSESPSLCPITEPLPSHRVGIKLPLELRNKRQPQVSNVA